MYLQFHTAFHLRRSTPTFSPPLEPQIPEVSKSDILTSDLPCPIRQSVSLLDFVSVMYINVIILHAQLRKQRYAEGNARDRNMNRTKEDKNEESQKYRKKREKKTVERK